MVLQLLTSEALDFRLSRLDVLMADAGIDTIFINDNATLFYLTGRVFCGYLMYRRDSRELRAFVRRPVTFTGKDVVSIHKPEQIAEHLDVPLGKTALETDNSPYSTVIRLAAALGLESFGNADAILRKARSVKAPDEIALIEHSGICQARVYTDMHRLYHEGMTDVELQIEIERASRLEGCLGIFRIGGNEMELYMGNVITGENADAPSPYDFAMGGAGQSPSLPVGANGTVIEPANPVMVDVNGNYTGYMTDMTRTYAVDPEHMSDEIKRIHQVSVNICAKLADMGRPGAKASDLYDQALQMACEAGLEKIFMGHRQHAGFVGHGVGIEINELPVISPRSRDILFAGNVIALEPKFVIPHVGAVGIENTYVVEPDGPMRCLTNAPMRILPLSY